MWIICMFCASRCDQTLISEFALSREFFSFFFTNLLAFFSALVYELLIASSWTWIAFAVVVVVVFSWFIIFNIYYNINI